MPNRVLRDWTDSEAVNSLDANEERFFTRLIMKVDDFGRFGANPKILKANLYPLLSDHVRDADISRWMAACQMAGLIVVYVVDLKPVLQIRNFGQQLRIKRSKYPEPPEECNAGDKQTHSICVADDKHMHTRKETETEVEIEIEKEGESEKANNQPISKKSKLTTAVKEKKTDMLFRDSIYFDKEKFCAAFTGTDYEHCHLEYYYERMLNWSDSKAVKRKDWIAQARNIMLSDADQNKLRLKNQVQNGQAQTTTGNFGKQKPDAEWATDTFKRVMEGM